MAERLRSTPKHWRNVDSVRYRSVVGDFNGDGIPDILASGGQGLWLFAGKGGGVFNSGVLTPIAGVYYYGLVAVDFNGDGKLDVAVGISS